MTTSILDTARSYVRAGLSVIPVRADGSKAPAGSLLPLRPDPETGKDVATWAPYQERQPTGEELEQWFGGDGDGVGVAIVCGAISGNLAVLDFETEAAFQEWCQTVGTFGLESVNGDPLVMPPGGGRHLYLHTPQPIPSMKLAKDRAGKTRIEVKGEGGYVLAPGCPGRCHPTGGVYAWLRSGWLK